MKTSSHKTKLSDVLLVLLLFGFFGARVKESKESESGLFTWPAWLGGTFLSDECDCDGPYTTPEGETYYWKVCQTKNLWGLNNTGWGKPFITSVPCT